MKIKYSYLILKTNKPVIESSIKLRGYFGNRFPDYPILHHHLEEAGYMYTYPMVQYHILEGNPCLLGIEDGSNVLFEISSQIENLILANNVYQVEERVLYQKEFDIKIGPKTQYSFITHWIALNSKNYHKYQDMHSWKDKKIFLNNILIGNILSMCKGLGIIVNRKLYVSSHLEEEMVDFKGISLTGFKGKFLVNFEIPDFFGLGKGVSQGFGSVKRSADADSGDL